MHGMAHPDAELGVAKGKLVLICNYQEENRIIKMFMGNASIFAIAAGALGTIYIAATIATTSIEDIAAAAPNARKWFQLYICKDRYGRRWSRSATWLE